MKSIIIVFAVLLFGTRYSFAGNEFNSQDFIKELINQELVSIKKIEIELLLIKKELSNLKIDLVTAQSDPDFKKNKLKTNIALVCTAVTGAFMAKIAFKGIKERYLGDPQSGYLFFGTILGFIPSAATFGIQLANLSNQEASLLEDKIDSRIEKIQYLESLIKEKRSELNRLKSL